MDELVSLDPHAKKREETVGFLRDALERAERGEVIGIAMVMLDSNGVSTQHLVTQWEHLRLAGALTFLLHKISSTGWED